MATSFLNLTAADLVSAQTPTLSSSKSSLSDDNTLFPSSNRSGSISSSDPIPFWEWQVDNNNNPYSSCNCEHTDNIVDSSRVFYRLVLGSPVAKGHPNPTSILLIGYANPQHVTDIAMTFQLSFITCMLPQPLPEFIPNCKQIPLNQSEVLPFQDGSFDLIIQYGFMTDGPPTNWKHRMTELYRVLNNEGVLELHEPLPSLYHHDSTELSYTHRLNAVFQGLAEHTHTGFLNFNDQIATIVHQNKLGCIDSNLQLAVPLSHHGGCVGNIAYTHYQQKLWTFKSLAMRLGIVEDAEYEQMVKGWQQDVQNDEPISLIYSVMVVKKCAKTKLSFGERLRLMFSGRGKEACPIQVKPCKLHKH